MNALANVALVSLVKYSLRVATKEAKENLCGARGSMWAVLVAIAMALTSSDLLLTDKEISILNRSEILYGITSLAVGLGLLVTGLFAADSMVVERERAAPDGTVLTTTKRRALLLGKVLGVMVMWLLTFVISVPYILLVGFGTSVSWVALTYTFVLGTLCVAGFTTLTVGLGALLRSGRGVTLVSLAAFVAMSAPTLLGTAFRKNWFGDTYNVLSPLGQARLSLESVIVNKENLLMQLSHIGALTTFAVIAGAIAAVVARGVSLGGDPKSWDLHETTVPAERTGSRLAGPAPEDSVGL